MEVKKLGPDHYTYTGILGALTEAGRIKEAEELMTKVAEMGKSSDESIAVDKGQYMVTGESPENSDPGSIAYSEEINELCSAGKYKDAMRIFGELTQKGVAVNKSTYVTLMKGLVKRKRSISKGA